MFQCNECGIEKEDRMHEYFKAHSTEETPGLIWNQFTKRMECSPIYICRDCSAKLMERKCKPI